MSDDDARLLEAATVYGRLLEAAHLSGYSFHRAIAELKWMLTDGRWKQVGGFDNVNAFLATIDFSEFRLAVEERKEIVSLLKLIDASQRATAKVLGVDHKTVSRDLRSGENSPPHIAEPQEPVTATAAGGENSPPPPASPTASLPTVLKAIKGQEKQADKGSKRAEKEAALGAFQRALPDKVYGLVMADPPWRFEPYSRVTGMDRSPDNHYATTETVKLAAHRPKMADASGCFMWATAPMIEDALWLLREWGFEYKSQWIWRKDRMGTGYWGRNVHELLLIGTRGSFPAPAPGDQPLSVIDAPVGEHSEKPVVFHGIIERLYPSLPKLEMYARSGRPGWDAWGNELDEVAA